MDPVVNRYIHHVGYILEAAKLFLRYGYTSTYNAIKEIEMHIKCFTADYTSMQ